MLTLPLPILLSITYISSAYRYSTVPKDSYTYTGVFNENEYCSEISQPDDNLKIMVLTDIHYQDSIPYNQSKRYIENMINDYKPGLILMDGDNVDEKWGYSVDKFDNMFKTIPWATNFGNHEGDAGIGQKYWIANKYLKASNCLFKTGPKNFKGAGNYVLNIKNNESQLIHSFIFLDCVHKNSYKVTDQQKEWYKTAINGLENLNHISNWKATIMLHVPLPQFNLYTGEGKNEKVCSSPENGFFDEVVQNGNVDEIICGHDHRNHYSFTKDGIKLTYAVKSSKNGYGIKGTGFYGIELRNDGTIEEDYHYF